MLQPLTKKNYLRPGRPSVNGVADFREKPLYHLLMKAFPKCVKVEDSDDTNLEKSLRVTKLAKYLQISSPAVYAWLHGGKMSSKAVHLLVQKSEGRITASELIDYLL